MRQIARANSLYGRPARFTKCNRQAGQCLQNAKPPSKRQGNFQWSAVCIGISHMKILLLVALLIGGTYVYRAKMAGSVEDLQGRWKITSMPGGWKKVPAMDVMVTEEEIQIRVGTLITSKLQYTVDPENQTIDATAPGKDPQLGVYEIDGETLTLSVGGEGQPRPKNPDSTEGGAMRWVLERAPQL